MIEGLKAWAARRVRSARPPTRALPPGVDEVRLLETTDALTLAELAAVLAALDQSIEAMGKLASDRDSARASTDGVTDLALLRFAIVQFVSCFTARRGSPRLTPKKAFDAAGVKFFAHVAAFADQLNGAHARVVGETETVVLLKRDGHRAGVLGLTTRARRPERLTTLELNSLIEFMQRGRDAYIQAFEQARVKVLGEVEAMTAGELLALELKDNPHR